MNHWKIFFCSDAMKNLIFVKCQKTNFYKESFFIFDQQKIFSTLFKLSSMHSKILFLSNQIESVLDDKQ